jgi:hypothetical protein
VTAHLIVRCDACEKEHRFEVSDPSELGTRTLQGVVRVEVKDPDGGFTSTHYACSCPSGKQFAFANTSKCLKLLFIRLVNQIRTGE